MTKVVGRSIEKAEIDRVMNSENPELLVVYGRRRVGKTFLIREHLKKEIVFELTGLHNETMPRQLDNFARAMKRHFGGGNRCPESWLAAFDQLKEQLGRTKSNGKCVLFFDEFPWLATRRSGFLAAFEEFWNTFASRHPGIVCVICGSAASWMIRNVINNKGGLHNRTTARIRLEPFTLGETRQYLKQRHIKLTDFQVAQLYMVLGGIPHYLQQIEKGKSAAQNVDSLCFAKEGLLVGEFDNLYRALFEQSDRHEAVVRALAGKRRGLTRSEITAATNLKNGGTLTKILHELLESGFIKEIPGLHASRKNSLLRLADEYSQFYLTWMETNRMRGDNIWLSKSSGSRWKPWCGYAFENLCLKHTFQIKQALGISGVLTEEASWHYRAKDKDEQGAQIDLLIDRNDHCINVCEMKFTEAPFVINKRYAEELRRKIAVFKQQSRTRKTVFLTIVSATGIRANEYSRELVANEVTLEQLFT